jgi:hypothetical protein
VRFGAGRRTERYSPVPDRTTNSSSIT